MSSASNTGIVILSAGSSSRLGQPKQLLQYGDKSLLQHTIDTAVYADADSVVVVLGTNAELISGTINKRDGHITENKEWPLR